MYREMPRTEQSVWGDKSPLWVLFITGRLGSLAGWVPLSTAGSNTQCGLEASLWCPCKHIFFTYNIQTPPQDDWIMEPKNQEAGKRTMDYDGLIPHFKYNEHLIHLKAFSNWRHIGGGAFEFTNTLNHFHGDRVAQTSNLWAVFWESPTKPA